MLHISTCGILLLCWVVSPARGHEDGVTLSHQLDGATTLVDTLLLDLLLTYHTPARAHAHTLCLSLSLSFVLCTSECVCRTFDPDRRWPARCSNTIAPSPALIITLFAHWFGEARGREERVKRLRLGWVVAMVTMVVPFKLASGNAHHQAKESGKGGVSISSARSRRWPSGDRVLQIGVGNNAFDSCLAEEGVAIAIRESRRRIRERIWFPVAGEDELDGCLCCSCMGMGMDWPWMDQLDISEINKNVQR
uniref:Putative secreted protein n=1 Tax=Anopheles darlingi TaxID=43151 RepID=A0A2M4DDE3_ANODA